MVWIPPTNIYVPITQQDALPLFQLGLAGAAGYFVSFAGTVFRYWPPLVLNFGVPTLNVPLLASYGIVSETLDLRGCRELALVTKRVVPGVAPVGYSLKIYVWPQFSDGAAALFTADVQESLNAFTTSLAPVSGTGTYVYNATISRGAGAGGTKNLTAAFGIGFAKIVVVGFSAAGAGDTTFTWELWGQG